MNDEFQVSETLAAEGWIFDKPREAFIIDLEKQADAARSRFFTRFLNEYDRRNKGPEVRYIGGLNSE